MESSRPVIKSLILACGIALTACSSDDSSTPATPAKTLSGTAAAGAAIIGQVTVKGSLGVTKSALIEADGNYTVDVTGLTAPYRLRAEGTVGGRTYKLHSYAEAADVGGNVNITPFTDLIVANAAQQVAESYFDSNTPADLDPVVVDAQEDALQAKLQDVFTALGVSTAIDLLNSTFSADRTGLDSALDVISIEVDPLLNVATITNLVESTSITDSVVDTTDNTTTLTVVDPTALTDTVTDNQAIVAKFDAFAAAFASGLPTQATIQDLFSADFSEEDTPLGPFLTDITTDPSIIGLTFSGIVISNLDSTAGTATVTFNFGVNDYVEPETDVWFVAKDPTLGWQIRGDQRIVETDFSFHCNDGSGTGTGAGACGVNTRFWDNDFSNNGTGNVAIASGTVSIIDGSNGTTVKDVIFLGTPSGTAPGDVQVYDESFGGYSGDWRAFGTGPGQIDSSIFVAGDIIQHDVYTEALDVTTGGASAPQIDAGAVAVATYTDTLVFAPSVTAKYPDATSATVSAINNFTLGNNLTIAWTLAAGTRNSEVLVEISDSLGNRIETWIETLGTTATSQTIASSLLDSAAASAAGLDPGATTYNLLVRIYAEDEVTGQAHSRDYTAAIPGPASTGGTTFACNYESGWDDLADGGLGAPITPNSFADYEAVIADCGTAMAFTAANIAGTAYDDLGDISTFDSTAAAGTQADPGTGSFNDGVSVINFEWYVEAATCSGCTHNYVVVYSDSTIAPTELPAGFSFRETAALIGISGTPGASGSGYSFVKYSEQSNYGDMIRANGADAEIWSSTDTLQ